MRTNWHIITGGPSSGKTTLLNALAERGYKTVPEAARTLIDRGLAEGKSIDDIRGDELAFQMKVLELKQDIESKLSQNEIIFFDRGQHDTLAYLKLYDFPISETVTDALAAASYGQVFLLEPLANFEADYARTESAEQARKLHQLLAEAYDSYGIKPRTVPAISVADRVEFILEAIENAKVA